MSDLSIILRNLYAERKLPTWGEIHDAADEIERLREALKFARKRLEYYGTISHRRHFDHDMAEVYPKIDAALNQQETKL